jgi:hypothetical protein
MSGSHNVNIPGGGERGGGAGGGYKLYGIH